RALTFNPGGVLTGAAGLTVAGTSIYVVTRDELVVVDAAEPLKPRIAARLKGFRQPAAVAVQLRYAFVADGDGLAVVDVTDPEAPRLAGRAGGFEGRSVYVARTWAYVAAGEKGIALVDVERPEAPKLAPPGAAPHRHPPHPGAGRGSLEGAGPRPGGGRERQPGERLQPPRRASLQR